jgi:hypothetical protein
MEPSTGFVPTDLCEGVGSWYGPLNCLFPQPDSSANLLNLEKAMTTMTDEKKLELKQSWQDTFADYSIGEIPE